MCAFVKNKHVCVHKFVHQYNRVNHDLKAGVGFTNKNKKSIFIARFQRFSSLFKTQFVMITYRDAMHLKTEFREFF